MNAYLAAGAIPQDQDALFSHTRGKPKALLPLAGRPMIQWLLDALNEASEIERVAIVGLEPPQDLHSDKPLTYIPNQGEMLLNALAGLAWVREVDPQAEYALFCSADIPTVSAEMVDWRVQTAMERLPFDLDYAVVTQEAMEHRFPDSNRSYVAFKDAKVCGADMNLLRVDLAVQPEFWRRMIKARKSAWRQASLFGFDLLLLLLLRRLTLRQAEQRASERLGLIGHLQIAPFPELAMDVDKPHQMEIVQQYLDINMKDRS